jgi:hypothetical protein
VQLAVHRGNDRGRVFRGERSGSVKRGLDVRYDERRGKAFTGCIGNSERDAAAGQGYEVEAIAAQRAHLPATAMVGEPLCFGTRDLHESFLQAACHHPVLADVHYYGFGNHLFCASVDKSK